METIPTEEKRLDIADATPIERIELEAKEQGHERIEGLNLSEGKKEEIREVFDKKLETSIAKSSEEIRVSLSKAEGDVGALEKRMMKIQATNALTEAIKEIKEEKKLAA